MFAHAHHAKTRSSNARLRLILVFGALLATPLVAQQTPSPNDTEGHCRFNLQNQWAGPYRACIDPSTPTQCTDTGKRDQNSDATFAPGSCPAPGRVGTCAKPGASVHYYDGDAASIEVGCGFQGGSWKVGS